MAPHTNMPAIALAHATTAFSVAIFMTSCLDAFGAPKKVLRCVSVASDKEERN